VGIATALGSPTDCAQGRDGATTRGNGVRRAVGLSAGEILAKVPLFSGLPAGERERLGRRLFPRRYARGTVIFLEGDAGTTLCLIVTGADGREVVLNVYGPGEIVGELALLDGEPTLSPGTRPGCSGSSARTSRR
jgi:Cyclic nucleotide-binding domain